MITREIIVIASRRAVVVGGVVLSMLAGGALAPSTSAALRFYWKVRGSKLEGTETAALTNIKLSAGMLKINGTDASSTAYEVVCTALVKATGSNPMLRGGTSGRLTMPLQFEGCSVASPAGCTVRGNKIATVSPLLGEIAEGVGLSGGAPVIALFESTGALNFATIEIAGCGVEANNAIKGILVAEARNPPAEFSIQKFKLEAMEPENIKEYGRPCTSPAGLWQPGSGSNRNRVTIQGEFSAELSSSAVFGAF